MLYKKKLKLQNGGATPPDIYQLGTVYTVNKLNPDSPFFDVQLCTGGGINPRETALNAGKREALEECGLITNGEHLNTINTIPGLYTYFVNADIVGNVLLNPPGMGQAPVKRRRIGIAHVMIYGSLAKLQGLVRGIVNRTDLNDTQGIALVKLT